MALCFLSAADVTSCAHKCYGTSRVSSLCWFGCAFFVRWRGRERKCETTPAWSAVLLRGVCDSRCRDVQSKRQELPNDT
jgi:hypothetical protein